MIAPTPLGHDLDVDEEAGAAPAKAETNGVKKEEQEEGGDAGETAS